MKKNIITWTVENAYKILVIILFLVGVVLALGYGGSLIGDEYEKFMKQREVNNFFESYEKKLQSGEVSSSDEAIISYLGYSRTEVETMTRQEKVVTNTKLATNLAVYDLKMDIVTDLNGNFKCAGLNSFEYDDEFDQFTVNLKWQNFYDGLSIFSTDYRYDYFSNVYVKGDNDFRINYREDETKTVYTKHSTGVTKWLVGGVLLALSDSDTVFVDRVQIVLPDMDNDKIPNDIDLNYKVSIIPYKEGDKLDSQLYEIPLSIRDGRIEIDGGMRC